jgi:hypothetical protein
MKVAGIRKFRRDAPRLIRGRELVLVTNHGRPQGFLLPFKDLRKMPREIRIEFLKQSGRELREHFRRLGVTEKQLLAGFKAWRKARRARRRGR